MDQKLPAGMLAGIAMRSASQAPITVVQQARVTCEHGVEGDFRGRPGNRQVTVLASEDWEEVCNELGLRLPWTTRRANLLTEGIPLKERTDYLLRIGTLVLKITGETFPCKRMDAACSGLRKTLTPFWRGGATCCVIQSGTIKVGDPIRIEHCEDNI